MFSPKINIVSLGVALTLSSQLIIGLNPSLAQEQSIPPNCQLLKEVTTGETQITKKIRRRVVQGDNFNTDFVVPSGIAFKSYKARMMVENDAKYDIGVNLKYADNSVTSALEKKGIPMVRKKNYDLEFRTPTENQPYQVNVYIGGPNNNTYTIAIMACK
jgi:hypothetical protein